MFKKLFLTILFLLSIITLTSLSWESALSSDKTIYGGGLLYGRVLGFNMYDELIPLEWAKVIVIDENGEIVESVSTLNGGYYEMFLPTGKFRLKVEHPGYIAQSIDIAISNGSSTSINFYLKPSGIPIPEFPSSIVQLLMVFTLLASIIVLMRIKNFKLFQGNCL